MNVVPQSVHMPGMVAARLPVAAADDPAVIVLGERLHGLCVALGVPTRDWLWMAHWVDVPAPRSVEVLGVYVDVLVAERCRCPGEDLVSDLVAHQVHGRALTAAEIRAIVVGLLLA